MSSEESTTHSSPRVDTLAWVLLAVGLYIVLGLAFAAAAADWPPFWPPMLLMTAPLEVLATERSVVGLTMLYGLAVVVIGFACLFTGARRLISNRRGATKSH